MSAGAIHRISGPEVRPTLIANRGTRGFSLVELMVVVAIVVTVACISLPIINTTLTNMRLGSAASSLAGAIQTTRYQAISIGCPFTLSVMPLSNSYQVATEPVSGIPPACGTAYVNGGLIPFSSSDISVNSSQTLVLNPSGTVTTVGSTLPASFTIILSNGAATKTVKVSGVGNVKVTAP